jgi:tetratricopeptide (TPR) repeat protein
VVISAIGGTAGIGKTTLAVFWAHQVSGCFPCGTLYANLRGYGPGQPAAPGEVLGGFLSALGTTPERIPVAEEDRAALYRSLLDGRKMLVVLDNARSPGQVRPLLPGSPGCLVLVTSRSAMTGLVISQGAARIGLDLLSPGEAAALLRKIIGDARCDAEPQALDGIVQACARLPLALRVAGARAASRPQLNLAALYADLLDEHKRLDALSCADDEETTVRAVFAWSYEALPPGPALVFRRLGLHPGVETGVHAAAALAGVSPDQAREELETLAEVHLVEPTVPGRYITHGLLRAYALERTGREGERELAAARDRMLGFYLHTADAADRAVMVRYRLPLENASADSHVLSFASLEQGMRWFDAEYANLVAAARSAAAAGLYVLAWQLPAALTGLFYRSGHRGDWLTALENGVAAARAVADRRGEQYLLGCLSDALTGLRRPEEGAACARQALDIARQDSDRRGEAFAMEGLGIAYQGARRLEDAARCLRRARDINRELDDPWGEAVNLIFLGGIYQELERLDEAVSCQERALAVFRQARDHDREGYTLRLLGDAYLAAGHHGLAVDCHTQALEIADRIGHRRNQAEALDGLGADASSLGDEHGARDHWQRAMELYEQIGDPRAGDIRVRLSA